MSKNWQKVISLYSRNSKNQTYR